ncbi:MAG: ferrous iron transport protein B [Lachnospiraceae bacterium]|nr:ferrous iron transport protein B [Lachnospiraceae bacterium]
MGDPMELRIHGYELTIRIADAQQITVIPAGHHTGSQTASESVSERDSALSADDSSAPSSYARAAYENASHANKREENAESKKTALRPKTEHPGLGEAGRFHQPGDGDPLPDDTLLTFALVGNQNSGKTTLFNQLTGSNQHVGNFPGVTVSRKDGAIRRHPNTLVTDLPGIYSMSPYSSEELISRNYVLEEKPRAIINIIDATNIERNMYLTIQLLEMNIPMVVALNMMDEVRGNGGSIDINKLESLLGVPVIPISAARGEGIEELVDHAIHVAHYQERPLRQDFCDENDHGGAVHRCLHAVAHLIEDHAERADLPVRFASSKIIEGDSLLLEKLGLDQNEKQLLNHIIVQMENERGMDKSAAIADMRYAFIFKICGQTVYRARESHEHVRSRKIDRVLTGRYTAIPVFVLIMAAVFYLTFNVIGAWLQGLLETGIESLTVSIDNILTAANVNPAIHSLIVDGIFAGVGSVLSFIPIIVIMFLFLSLLEDSGYIARVAFVMDHMLRRIGLSGRSIVPMLIGFGCSVPAVMATRTLPSDRDRRMTILLTPFMSCTAKIPIYAFFVNAFFPGRGGLIMTGLYVLGILTGILAAFLYKGTLFRGEAVPFVMELPNYRLPGLRNTLQLLWEKARDFLQRAFSVILIATILIWFLQNFNLHLNMVDNSADSILAMVSGLLVPLFKPIGLGDWRICTSLISGFMAKESVVSTLEILYEGGVTSVMTPLMAAGLLVFSLLYTPCVAAVAAVRRELGMKWAASLVVWQCAIAWIAALIVRIIGSFL